MKIPISISDQIITADPRSFSAARFVEYCVEMKQPSMDKTPDWILAPRPARRHRDWLFWNQANNKHEAIEVTISLPKW